MTKLTRIDFAIIILASKLNVNEINFELLVGIDSDQEGGATAGSDDPWGNGST